MHFNFDWFLFGVAGWFLQSLFKSKSIRDDAKKNNIAYKFTEYYTSDWLSHLITFASIAIAVVLVDEWYSVIPSLQGLIKSFFVAVGISNGAIVSYVLQFLSSKFSVSAQVKQAIDYKTTIADKANNTIAQPTPRK